MSDYGHELRDCLREILGTVPPPPEDDALLYFNCLVYTTPSPRDA
jgi:hypothetical protein